MTSSKMTLNKEDLKKIGKGALFAGGGAVCAYLLTVVPDLDFGPQTLLISTVVSILLNAAVKFFQEK